MYHRYISDRSVAPSIENVFESLELEEPSIDALGGEPARLSDQPASPTGSESPVELNSPGTADQAFKIPERLRSLLVTRDKDLDALRVRLRSTLAAASPTTKPPPRSADESTAPPPEQVFDANVLVGTGPGSASEDVIEASRRGLRALDLEEKERKARRTIEHASGSNDYLRTDNLIGFACPT